MPSFLWEAMIESLLTSAGVELPDTPEAGIYPDEELQAFYNEMLKAGKQSELDVAASLAFAFSHGVCAKALSANRATFFSLAFANKRFPKSPLIMQITFNGNSTESQSKRSNTATPSPTASKFS